MTLDPLLNDAETLDTFFTALRSGDPEFLDILANENITLHLLMDRDFILGGHIASYFEETDKKKLGNTFTQNAK